MSSARKSTILLAAGVLLTGCGHRTKATPPASAQAPSLPVSTLARNAPPPQLPPPTTPKINPPSATNAAPQPSAKPPKPSHHKFRHTTVEASPLEQAQAPAKPAPIERASNGASSDISPIGQLSAAGESSNSPRRNQILDEINSTEKGLDELKRPLTHEEQTTAAQIRTFLTKARDSIKQEDLDGAHTLVTKAKVLLAELTNP